MPTHVVMGHLVVVTAPLAAVLALCYAWLPGVRSGMRWPLVVVSAVNAGLAYAAGTTGVRLLDDLRGRADAAGQALPPAVRAHTAQADALSLASLALLLLVLTVVWWLLSPPRPPGAATLIGACLLTVGVLAVGWFTATTLLEAMRAVWAQHPMWSG
ncbi:hypothetical protein AB0J72_23450 [Dactylosporangium sp. NPDC049742]|uniref:hypothetical protein n=1 Tax=Dactylosporangium sp. NPDC049742 TaxID=3154737 RepID=UPI00341614E9